MITIKYFEINQYVINCFVFVDKKGHSINKVMLSKSRLYRGPLDPSICMSVTRCTFSHLMIFDNFGSLKNCYSLKN